MFIIHNRINALIRPMETEIKKNIFMFIVQISNYILYLGNEMDGWIDLKLIII